MLRASMGRVYSLADNTALVDDMLALERDARAQNKGIWGLRYYAIRAPESVTGDVGSFQLVRGVVTDAALVRGRVYLNFGADYRTDFTILVPPKVRRAFERQGVDLLALEGQAVQVRGWVKSFNGPMIELTHVEQLELPAALDAGTKKDPPEGGSDVSGE